MSLTPIRDINAALVLAYKSCGISLPTAYPAKEFNVTGVTFAEIFVMFASRRVLTMGDKGEDRLTGILQVNVHVPEDTGIGELFSNLDTVSSYFSAGSTFTYNGQSVKIYRAPDPSPLGRSEKLAGNVQSVSVYWMADVLRNVALNEVVAGTDPYDYEAIFEESL